MNKLLLTCAITMLGTSLAFAQTTKQTGEKTDCSGIATKAHPGTGDWTDAEMKPFLDKMKEKNMKTATEGKFTSDEFMTACNGGAFEGM